MKSSDAIITDRNRTSPIAFTGNKFEFRATGSSQSLSLVTTMLNAIYSSSIKDVLEEIGTKNLTKSDIARLISNLYNKHSCVIYNDNCYDTLWEHERKQRGLENLRFTPAALNAYSDENNIEMLENLGIYTRDELISRKRIYTQDYIRNIRLESAVMIEMVEKEIIPCIRDQVLINNESSLKRIEVYNIYSKNIEDSFCDLVEDIKLLEKYLQESTSCDDKDTKDADEIRKVMVPLMEKIRNSVDNLEKYIPHDKWPYPSYEELLFKL